MAWLRHVPPLARHPRDRWQVRYRDDADQERSAGIYPTQAAANAVKRRLDRGESLQSIRAAVAHRVRAAEARPGGGDGAVADLAEGLGLH
jgi:hypothetical protein